MNDAPCKHGHTSGRNKSGQCKECNRLRQRERRKKNPLIDRYTNWKYDHSEKGVITRKRTKLDSNIKFYTKDAAKAGIHQDARRKIEDREILRDLGLE